MQGNLIHLFRLVILKDILRSRGSNVSAVLGVALGVAVVLAVYLANAGATASFKRAAQSVAGPRTLEISTPRGFISDANALDVLSLVVPARATPFIEGAVVLRENQGDSSFVRLIGVDLLAPFSLLKDATFSENTGQSLSRDTVLALVSQPDAVLASEKLLQRLRKRVGESLSLLVGDRKVSVRILASIRGDDLYANQDILLGDISAAQFILGKIGSVDSVLVRPEDNSSIDKLAKKLSKVLKPPFEVREPRDSFNSIEEMLAAFQFNLAALAAISIFVGLFLVGNAVTLSISRRIGEIGVVRAVGVAGHTVSALFLLHATLLCFLGSLIGIPLGAWLGEAAVKLTGQTVEVFYLSAAATGALRAASLGWSETLLVVALVTALGPVAALGPIFRARRVSPIEALASKRGRKAGPISLGVYVFIVLLLLLAGACAQAPKVFGLPVFGFVSALCILLALGLLVQFVLPAVAKAGKFFARSSLVVRVAASELTHSIQRIAAPGAALVAAFGMMVAIASMVSGFRETVHDWIDKSLAAELMIRPAGKSVIDAAGSISDEAIAIIKLTSGVSAVIENAAIPVVDRGRKTLYIGSRIPKNGRQLPRMYVGDAPSSSDFDALRQGTAVLISEPYARRNSLQRGDMTLLPALNSNSPYLVAGVYRDFSNTGGAVTFGLTPFTQLFDSRAFVSSLAVFLDSGANASSVKETLSSALQGKSELFIATNAWLHGEVTRIFEDTFSITYALLAVSIFAAAGGVFVAMRLLLYDRRRDLAIIRAIGVTTTKVRVLAAYEGCLISCTAYALGAVAGILVSLLLVFVINVQSFGWTIYFRIPGSFIIGAGVLSASAGAFAGLMAIRSSLRASLVEEIRDE